MDTIKLIKEILQGILFVLKCIGVSLAILVFISLGLQKMPLQEAVRILSLSIICLGAGEFLDVF